MLVDGLREKEDQALVPVFWPSAGFGPGPGGYTTWGMGVGAAWRGWDRVAAPQSPDHHCRDGPWGSWLGHRAGGTWFKRKAPPGPEERLIKPGAVAPLA